VRHVLTRCFAGSDLLLPALVTDQPVEAVGLEGEELGKLERLESPDEVRAAKRNPSTRFAGGFAARRPPNSHRTG
jgi:hypothetical protein